VYSIVLLHTHSLAKHSSVLVTSLMSICPSTAAAAATNITTINIITVHGIITITTMHTTTFHQSTTTGTVAFLPLTRQRGVHPLPIYPIIRTLRAPALAGGPGAGGSGKRFYLFCMAYGDCKPNGCATPQCGGRLDHNVSLYTSPNLTSGSWVYEGNLLPIPSRPNGVYYRPKVVFNKATGLYVLWVNWMPQGDFMKSQYVPTQRFPSLHVVACFVHPRRHPSISSVLFAVQLFSELLVL
jgi:hypothetical protein